MISGGAIIEFGISEHEFTAMGDDAAFLAFLALATSPRCYLLELDAFSLAASGGVSAAISDAGIAEVGISENDAPAAGSVLTLRFGSQEYTSTAADTPANTSYQGRIIDAPVAERRISGRDGVGGLTEVFGEIALRNEDGALDFLKRDYAVEGRRVRILIGDATAARSTFWEFFVGITQSVELTEGEVRITLSDGSAKLRRLVNEALYAGGGGLEGGDDLKGKSKPVALGQCLNVPAPLVDSAKLIYQVHDGAISDVPAAYDRGVVLTKGADYADASEMDTVAPAAGEYRVWKDGGYFRLGATPAGQVTADVKGEASPSYSDNTADIVLRILALRCALVADEIDSASFSNLASSAAAPVGVWYGTGAVSCAQAVDELLYGVGAFGGFDRFGLFNVGLVASPTGAMSSFEVDSIDIRSVQIARLPASVEPIVWRVGVSWQRNYAVQTDLAASVTAARRTFCAESVRVSTGENASTQSRHLLAQALGPVESLYAIEADAQIERDRLLALWGARRTLYRVGLFALGLARELGDVGIFSHPRFGMADGVAGRVVGHRAEGTRTELLVLT
jgi:hypothetical protein